MTWRTILCAVGSETASGDAVRVAARLAREDHAELTLLHVDEDHAEPLLAPPPASEVSERDEETARWSRLALDVSGEPAHLELATGHPAEKIVEEARRTGADLIVLGSQAKSRASLALGSVVGGVIAHAPCPVIVVPAGLEDLKTDFAGQVA